ncbi:MAG TPA: hypothetical protein VFF29_01255 [Bacteroidota bacterium]|nr:hypothetical protein [Bacteroidota bacterium]
MDEKNQINPKDDHFLHRLMKSLPRVKASPDFEARLQRRILEESKSRGIFGLFTKTSSLMRLPAFAYSLIALISVGLGSYYIYLRVGVSPIVPSESIPSNQQYENETKQKSTGGQSGIDRSDARSESTPKDQLSRRIDAPVTAGKQSAVSDETKKPQTDDQLSIPPTEQFQELEKAKSDYPKKIREQNLEPASVSRSQKEAVVQEPTQEIKLMDKLESGQGIEAQQFQKVQVDRVSKDRDRTMAPLQSPEGGYRIRAGASTIQSQYQRDSAILADSIKQDSLMRLQKKLQLQRQQLKIKKPS